MLLHGFLSCNAQWLMNRDALAADHYLVQVELWGHGNSPAPESSEGYSVDRYAMEFERIRSELGIDRWHVIGQSYGAGLVCHYAASHAELCDRVIVTNSRSGFGDIRRNSPSAKRSRQEIKHPRDLPLHPVNARRFPEHVKAAMVEAADRMDTAVIRDSSRLAMTLNATETLRTIAPRTLLANGVYEKAFQPEVEALRARFPELLIVDMEGGHSVNIEAATEFNDAVTNFLAGS